MNIQFLETSSFGLRWMKAYCRNEPQLNRGQAFQNFLNAQTLLTQQPHLGHVYEDYKQVRELKIRNSHFSIVYTFQHQTIYVIDIRDQRGMRSAEALQAFNTTIRKKYNLSI